MSLMTSISEDIRNIPIMVKRMMTTETHEDRFCVAGLTGTGGIVGLCWLDIAHCSLTER